MSINLISIEFDIVYKKIERINIIVELIFNI